MSSLQASFRPSTPVPSAVKTNPFSDTSLACIPAEGGQRGLSTGSVHAIAPANNASNGLRQWLSDARQLATRPKDLVVNWHITEACNYSCKYCYAEWDRLAARELMHDVSGSSALLAELQAFAESNLLPGQHLRLNIAGGEPLLYADRCTALLQEAESRGLATSIITNGSLLGDEWIKENATRLDVLGISLDSVVSSTADAIGRNDKRGKRVTDWKHLAGLIGTARALNPKIVIKLNTVVNSLNASESLDAALSLIKPEQWKVLQMLPSVTDATALSSDQFQAYLARHHAWRHVMRPEDNESMQGSYLMIDPFGRLFQNKPGGKGYSYSQPMQVAGFAQAVREVDWSPVKFLKRYNLQDAA